MVRKVCLDNGDSLVVLAERGAHAVYDATYYRGECRLADKPRFVGSYADSMAYAERVRLEVAECSLF